MASSEQTPAQRITACREKLQRDAWQYQPVFCGLVSDLLVDVETDTVAYDPCWGTIERASRNDAALRTLSIIESSLQEARNGE